MSPQDTLPFESAGGAAPPAIVAPVRKLVASELRRCVSSRVKAAGVGQAHQPALDLGRRPLRRGRDGAGVGAMPSLKGWGEPELGLKAAGVLEN